MGGGEGGWPKRCVGIDMPLDWVVVLLASLMNGIGDGRRLFCIFVGSKLASSCASG